MLLFLLPVLLLFLLPLFCLLLRGRHLDLVALVSASLAACRRRAVLRLFFFLPSGSFAGVSPLGCRQAGSSFVFVFLFAVLVSVSAVWSGTSKVEDGFY